MKQCDLIKKQKKKQKWIQYEEVLEFLKWQFDEEFADQQINLFSVVEGEINENRSE